MKEMQKVTLKTEIRITTRFNDIIFYRFCRFKDFLIVERHFIDREIALGWLITKIWRDLCNFIILLWKFSRKIFYLGNSRRVALKNLIKCFVYVLRQHWINDKTFNSGKCNEKPSIVASMFWWSFYLRNNLKSRLKLARKS